MSRYTSYTLEFTDDRTNPDRERNRIDLSPFVISNFTHHMMGEISGRRRVRVLEKAAKKHGVNVGSHEADKDACIIV